MTHICDTERKTVGIRSEIQTTAIRIKLLYIYIYIFVNSESIFKFTRKTTVVNV